MRDVIQADLGKIIKWIDNGVVYMGEVKKVASGGICVWIPVEQWYVITMEWEWVYVDPIEYAEWQSSFFSKKY